jgi:glutathione S-transferase
MVEIEDYPARFAPEGKQADALKAVVLERIRERILIVQKSIHGPWMLESGFSAVDIYAAMFSRWSATHGWRDEHIPKLCAIMRGLADRPALGPVWQKFFSGTF